MKKGILIGMIAAMMLIMSFAVSAAAPNWDVTGTWAFNYVYGSSYAHTMIIDSMDLITVAFQWHGYYNANGAYTWIIIDGVVDGDNINFTIDYTGLNPTYYVNAIGTISSATYMNGTATAPGQSATWNAVGTAIAIDPDCDGIPYTTDKCADTVADNWTNTQLGVNRYMWAGSSWQTKTPKLKIIATAAADMNMDYTYGCSCIQILDSMVATTGFDFGGHYKFGCRKSILEDWNRGTYYVGPTWVETLIVPADTVSPTLSIATLELNKEYFL